MKIKMFTATDRGMAAVLLRKEGAKIPFGLFEASTQDILIGKFRYAPNCKDGYAVYQTTKEMISIMKEEQPEVSLENAAYTVIVVKNFKNDLEFLNAIGIR